MKAFKGFNKNMQCRGFQYEEGKEYTEDTAIICETGFHACEYPLDCFGYYAPAESKYCDVELGDDAKGDNDDTKFVSTRIRIGTEISLQSIIKASFEYVKTHSTNKKQGGDMSALQGGDRSALQGGYMSALQGGHMSALQGGDRSVIYGCGKEAKVKGGKGSVLALAEFDDNYNLVKVHVKIAGQDAKENTWYALIDGGFAEVE